jgi:DNA-directed RNA polymerase specialized sigma24 family protein
VGAWSELVAEYDAEVIGAQLLAEIRDVCKNIARKYPAGIYAVTADWRDSLDDLVDEVVAALLARDGAQLRYIMDVSASTSDFRGLVGKHTQRVLSHGRTRTVVDNLLDRSRRILAKPPWVEVGRRDGRPAYSLRDDATLEAPEPADLRRAADFAAKVPRIRPTHEEDRASQVYTPESLHVLLEIVASALPTAFTERDLAGLLAEVLTGWVPIRLEDDVQATDLARLDWSDAELDEARDLAMRALSRMAGDERRAVALAYRGRTHEQIADALGCSRPTAKKRLDAGYDYLNGALADLSELMQEFAIDFIALELARETR